MVVSLRIFADYGSKRNIDILVENHGGYSAEAKRVAEIIKKVNKYNVGALPDFVNFCLGKVENNKDSHYAPHIGLVE
jgi:sugar phosphate isomerase/epimerase